MALLGTWIDRTNQTIGGAAGANFFQTVQHAIQAGGAATTPDVILPVARSLQASTSAPVPYGFGANASIATLGLAVGSVSAASAPLCAIDVYSILFHSIIR